MKNPLLLSLGLLLNSALAQFTVVTSMHPHYDLLRQIVADKGTVIRLLPIGASPHTFDPSPSDVARVAEADLVIMNGGIDDWLLGLIEASATAAPVYELLELLDFEAISAKAHAHDEDGEAESHETEDHAAEEHGDDAANAEPSSENHAKHDSNVNPHIWLDPVLMIQVTAVLVEALAKADPANAAFYQANGEVLRQSLEALDAELAASLLPIKGAAFVPFHDAWPYFARRYGLHLVIEIEPAPGREPSAAYIAEALKLIRDSGAKAMFSDIQLPARPAEVVAENAGLPLYRLDPEGGGSSEEESYQDFMRKNAAILLEALSGGSQ